MTLENVIGAFDFPLSETVPGFDRKVVVVPHNTVRGRTICVDAGEEMLILVNGYVVSFLDNIALNVLTRPWLNSHGLVQSQRLTRGLAKKFFSEQLAAIAPSRFAHVLFLETIIAYDGELERTFALKAQDPELARSSDMFTAMAADFIRHHEIGHSVEHRADYEDYRTHGRTQIDQFGLSRSMSPAATQVMADEFAADLFAINCVIGIYAPLMSGPRLLNYLEFLVTAIVRMNALYAIAADAHRENVDAKYFAGDIDRRLEEWKMREAVMIRYLQGFQFGDESVLALASDSLVPLEIGSDIYDMASGNLSAPETESGRRLATAISAGFEPGAHFAEVVDATRLIRRLDRPLAR